MNEERHALILNLEGIVDFIFGDDHERHCDSEITEVYVMDEDDKNMQLSTKQLREVKGNDITPQESIRYELVKMMLDNIISIEGEEATFGNSVVINTMLAEGLITEIKEEDI